MKTLPLVDIEDVLEQTPVYGSHGQIGTVADIEDLDFRGQILHSLQKAYDQDIFDDEME